MLIEEQFLVRDMFACNLECPLDIDRWTKRMPLIKPNLCPWILPFPNTRLWPKPFPFSGDRLVHDVDPADKFLTLVSAA